MMNIVKFKKWLRRRRKKNLRGREEEGLDYPPPRGSNKILILVEYFMDLALLELSMDWLNK
jgi:hypothetical protein